MERKNRVKIKMMKTRWNTINIFNGKNLIGEISEEDLLKFLNNNSLDIEYFNKIG